MDFKRNGRERVDGKCYCGSRKGQMAVCHKISLSVLSGT
jgi:hypothetical protein